MTARAYRLLALWSCIGMLLVLIAGVVVTNTESGRGCGTDWPLCNGKFIPAYTVESIVEYTHRAVSGLEGFLVLAVFLLTMRLKPASGEARMYAGAALLFTIFQAVLGMLAVIMPTSDAVLAIHFGISMIAFTSTWLLYAWARRWDRALRAGDAGAWPIPKATVPAPGSLDGGRQGGSAAKIRPSFAGAGASAVSVPAGLFGWILSVIIYCYAVVYLGAYVRHTDSAGGCIGWPLCNGEVVPELSGATGIVFLHRVGAILLFLFIAAIVLLVRRRTGGHEELTRIGYVSLALVILQSLSGWLLTATLEHHDVYVFTSLLHTIIISILFSALCLWAIRAWQLSRR
ncbi:cytochrome c oxidase assembly protein subunit 15 [Cohnella sp. OV330]|uniref:COX15/CtaA family protein n=1 Tax=Cohnella sp. OV330 TaxID=1855288 RepID=UPI0008EC058C|nr:COX15/CtaA family protein [Cohnella sp. OV330]SFA95478.1 cytochrome c oxidase assembly protein subunit 15 [Cohnella sp. OV330]